VGAGGIATEDEIDVDSFAGCVRVDFGPCGMKPGSSSTMPPVARSLVDCQPGSALQ
jgi:hypothetical protein